MWSTVVYSKTIHIIADENYGVGGVRDIMMKYIKYSDSMSLVFMINWLEFSNIGRRQHRRLHNT